MNLLQRPAPDLCVIRADNPSPMTFEGTNTYILGRKRLVVIDPGPQDATHLARILNEIGGRAVTAILVTHSHKDHSPLAAPLGRALGAPVLAFGDSLTGRSDVMARLALDGGLGGGEGVDTGFTPDGTLADGERLPFENGDITAHWTPGHMGNHMCFQWRDQVFTGDHVMGWAPSLVSPPDGDMTAYIRSLHKVAALGARVFHSGHGASIDRPAERVGALIEHRKTREQAILAQLQNGEGSVESLTRAIYTDIDPALHRAAARNVFAHLVDLHVRADVMATPKLSAEATFTLARG